MRCYGCQGASVRVRTLEIQQILLLRTTSSHSLNFQPIHINYTSKRRNSCLDSGNVTLIGVAFIDFSQITSERHKPETSPIHFLWSGFEK